MTNSAVFNDKHHSFVENVAHKTQSKMLILLKNKIINIIIRNIEVK